MGTPEYGFEGLIAAAREAGGGPSRLEVPETREIRHSAPPPPAAPKSVSSRSEPPGRRGPWVWLGGAGAVATISLVWILSRSRFPTHGAQPSEDGWAADLRAGVSPLRLTGEFDRFTADRGALQEAQLTGYYVRASCDLHGGLLRKLAKGFSTPDCPCGSVRLGHD